jgi:hypothetical protein
MSKKHKYLVTINPAYDDLFLELHENTTVREALDKAQIHDNPVCIVLTPKNALELAKSLIDACYVGKTFDKPVAKRELEVSDD